MVIVAGRLTRSLCVSIPLMPSEHPTTSSKASVSKVGIAAVSSLAYVLCDLLHELLGHGAATLLPLGVKAVSVSTIGLSTDFANPVVAAAGPLVNLVFSLTLLASSADRIPPAWRYFAWLFGSINAFNATAYLLYSAILGTGDWAVAIGSLTSSPLLRPILGFLGLLTYGLAIYASLFFLRRLIAAGIVASSNADRYCTSSYWVGGILLTAGAALNPFSPWFILTSGAATGFGAMVGLLFLPPLLRRTSSSSTAVPESLRVSRGWVTAGAVAAVVFVTIFGPGVSLAWLYAK